MKKLPSVRLNELTCASHVAAANKQTCFTQERIQISISKSI